MKLRNITVKIPATSANLGSGFDCLGLALDLWNTVRIAVNEGAENSEIKITGYGLGDLSTDNTNLVLKSVLNVYEHVGIAAPNFLIHCDNLIPLKRGLGSSAAAIVGGCVAANQLLGEILSIDELLVRASEIEGHSDNVVAALMGGIKIVAKDNASLMTASVPTPNNLKTVLFIPDTSVSTLNARNSLPSMVPYDDVVFNLSRVALLVNSLATDRLEGLVVGTQDRLHQPHRIPLFPPAGLIMKEAIKAGALGAFLSGSGPTVLALARGREMTIAYEMAEAARKANLDGNIMITDISASGAYVVNDSDEELK
ncbi:homoserine kinase [SAR202 cluster bacterium AC-409-J13_OGT_754m]|nr:homoserine kinase [SAR202 cluster bacterium AC-409-J13_OGT_754m]